MANSRPPFSGPGIIFTQCRITHPDVLPPEVLTKWYKEAYIPKVLGSGLVARISMFQAVDSTKVPYPHVIVYEMDDVSPVRSENPWPTPGSEKIIPDGSSIQDLVDFDRRFYSLVQAYDQNDKSAAAFPTLLVAAMEPAEGGDVDLDAWYREEHLEQMAREPSWKKSTRYRLIQQLKNGVDYHDAPSWLALYEFGEGNALGSDVNPLDPMTEWTKRVMQQAKKIEAGIFERVGTWSKDGG